MLTAAADLDLFSGLAGKPLTVRQLAQKLDCDLRGLGILLDALVALKLLRKQQDRYSLPAELKPLLAGRGPKSVLGMTQHQGHCLRNWAQLAQVVKSGQPAKPVPSVRGEAGDRQSFIEAMHNVSESIAGKVIRAVQPLRFSHLLDVGGASGTWTIAFLRSAKSARATLFDLPDAIPMARQRLAAAGLTKRIRLVAGDFLKDPLPSGADLAWVSAIVHQNSRAQNRTLFGRVLEALVPGGRIAIRDVLMDENRTSPVAGALFAVNMLVATEGGGTFTFVELQEDLEASGFTDVVVLRWDEAMNSIVVARKPKLK